jgi:hypothetical protein
VAGTAVEEIVEEAVTEEKMESDHMVL